MATPDAGERDRGWIVFGVLFLCTVPFLLLAAAGLLSFGREWAATYGASGNAGTLTVTHTAQVGGGWRSPRNCYGDFHSDRGARTPDVKVKHSGSCDQGRRIPVRLADGTAYERGMWSWARLGATVFVTALFLVCGYAAFGFGTVFVKFGLRWVRG
ncbi:hypothetical protein ABZ806_01055 [Spirillospora sp. NPDC047418]